MTASNSKPPADLLLIQDPDRARLLLDPLRRKVLELARKPASATAIGERMSLPRQKVNYHLRTLEHAELIREVEQRRKGNCIERLMQTAAARFAIAPQVLGSLALDPAQVQDELSSTYLVAVAARTIADMAVLRRRANTAKKRLPTLTLDTEVCFGSARDQNAFAKELAAAMSVLVAKYHQPTAPKGRIFRCIGAAYPKITQSEKEA